MSPRSKMKPVTEMVILSHSKHDFHLLLFHGDNIFYLRKWALWFSKGKSQRTSWYPATSLFLSLFQSLKILRSFDVSVLVFLFSSCSEMHYMFVTYHHAWPPNLYWAIINSSSNFPAKLTQPRPNGSVAALFSGDSLHYWWPNCYFICRLPHTPPPPSPAPTMFFQVPREKWSLDWSEVNIAFWIIQC